MIQDDYSLISEGIPFPPRVCFNWLPQYRYGLFAYKALQSSCATKLKRQGNHVEFTPNGNCADADIPTHLVRPVLMDSVLRDTGWLGYVRGQAEELLHPFATGELFHPLTDDIALIVAKEQGSSQFLNNILSYMTPAPQSIDAALALGGGYSGATSAEISNSHVARIVAAEKLRTTICSMYKINDTRLVRIHSAGVGGLIEAATRYMHFQTPGYRTCILVPEYWDLLRCVLTYSPNGVSVVDGRERKEFPEDEWLTAISQPNVDFSYISYTNNPLGTTIPYVSLLKAIDAIDNDALFFIDCTSVDTEESSSVDVINDILRKFPHKNLLITKSFSKEYNKGHLRVGYGIFTRTDVADAFWPFMACYPPASITTELLTCLARGNAHVLDAYRKIGEQIRQFATAYPEIHISGTTSNYTSLFFKSEERCSEVLSSLENAYGSRVFPGELPMQGGGHLGLGQGEVSLTSMKRIPFLPKNALRLLVTETSFKQLHELL